MDTTVVQGGFAIKTAILSPDFSVIRDVKSVMGPLDLLGQDGKPTKVEKMGFFSGRAYSIWLCDTFTNQRRQYLWKCHQSTTLLLYDTRTSKENECEFAPIEMCLQDYLDLDAKTRWSYRLCTTKIVTDAKPTNEDMYITGREFANRTTLQRENTCIPSSIFAMCEKQRLDFVEGVIDTIAKMNGHCLVLNFKCKSLNEQFVLLTRSVGLKTIHEYGEKGFNVVDLKICFSRR